MSLKKNIIANYVSQIYVTLIGIVMVPLYIKYMGAEAYGLVGFFAMLLAWFNVLDMGLTPTMARETARYRGGAINVNTLRSLFRALELIFLGVAVILGVCVVAFSENISSDWLRVEALSLTEVTRTITIMGMIIPLRWMEGLYRSTIVGFEQQVWLGVINVIIATARFVAIIPILMYVGTSPTVFFLFQLGVAALELTVLLWKAYRLLPATPTGKRVAWSWAPLKPVLKFSLSIAFISSVWTLITQTDKLVLSKILPLTEYSYFTLAVLVASGVMIISGPISSAIMPRLAKLEAEGDHVGLIRVYRQATQLVAIVAGASSITIAFCAEPLLWAWTGDKLIAHSAAHILALYAMGNGVLAVSAFPYYLQYAKGDLRLHLIGNVLYVVFLIPTIIWAASQYGGVGAGFVWLAVNVVYFIFWIPLVHRRFEKGLHVKWFCLDVLAIYSSTSSVAYGVFMLMPITNNRWWQFGYIVIIGVSAILAGLLASSLFWGKVKLWLIQQQMKKKQVTF
jgi:O-antigen/teichoic acid export membrane protein